MVGGVRMRILETAYHRNGVGGVPFLAVTFADWDEEIGAVHTGSFRAK